MRGLKQMRRLESVFVVPLGASVLWLLVPGMVVGLIIDRGCVADEVEVTRSVLSATQVMFREEMGVEFGPWNVEATELPP
jgi:hypothetical protein